MQEVLERYELASGQVVNADKSYIAFSPNTKEEVKRGIKDILGITSTQTLQLYLGLPTFSSRQKRLQFGYLRDRVEKKLNGWNNKDFSAGGKEVLLKAVVLPNSFCKDIERMCKAFWWGDKEDKRKVHWKKREALCKPKCQGGMGFRDIKKFNESLLAKQLWRFVVNPELLVARVFKLKYCREGELLEATAKSGCSFVWRSIIESKGALEAGSSWKVGSGESIKVYGDRWVGGNTVNRL